MSSFPTSALCMGGNDCKVCERIRKEEAKRALTDVMVSIGAFGQMAPPPAPQEEKHRWVIERTLNPSKYSRSLNPYALRTRTIVTSTARTRSDAEQRIKERNARIRSFQDKLVGMFTAVEPIKKTVTAGDLSFGMTLYLRAPGIDGHGEKRTVVNGLRAENVLLISDTHVVAHTVDHLAELATLINEGMYSLEKPE